MEKFYTNAGSSTLQNLIPTRRPDLAGELKKLWNMKVSVIVVGVNVTGMGGVSEWRRDMGKWRSEEELKPFRP